VRDGDVIYLVVRHHDSAGGKVEDDSSIALLAHLTFHARVAANMGCDWCPPLVETEQEHRGAFQDVSLPSIVPATVEQSQRDAKPLLSVETTCLGQS